MYFLSSLAVKDVFLEGEKFKTVFKKRLIDLSLQWMFYKKKLNYIKVYPLRFS